MAKQCQESKLNLLQVGFMLCSCRLGNRLSVIRLAGSLVPRLFLKYHGSEKEGPDTKLYPNAGPGILIVVVSRKHMVKVHHSIV